MGKFNDHFNGRQNDEYEYYEDSHGGFSTNDRDSFSSDRDGFSSRDRDSFSRDGFTTDRGSNDRGGFSSRDEFPRATDYQSSDRDEFPRATDYSAPRRNDYETDREVRPRDTFAPREESRSVDTGYRAASNARRESFDVPSPEKVVGSGTNRITEYSPNTPEDVQTVIDSLRRGESAIVKLNGSDARGSQRVLDFLSGAIYAISGSIYRVEGNIFLLSPSGVGIKKS